MSPTADNLKSIYAALCENTGCVGAEDLASTTGLDQNLVEQGLEMLIKMGLAKNGQIPVEDIQFSPIQ